jgi:hypothetical protein
MIGGGVASERNPMALEIVGAGFGRTGTLSLKFALERLGFQQTYHMMELFQHPEHLATWERATRGEAVDWDPVFAGYRAAVDWPVAAFWRPLAERYPDSRVILTVRDADAWIDSVHKTIYPASLAARSAEDAETRRWGDWVFQLIWDGTFHGRMDDRRHLKEVYLNHAEDVKRSVPADRLLVFEASQGWAPLCRFLSVDVPDEPYPRVNSSEEFGRL